MGNVVVAVDVSLYEVTRLLEDVARSLRGWPHFEEIFPIT
jgi:hypothetical protein